jgi:hypothetical protein
MIIYNWLIFKDVLLRLKPNGIKNGIDANVTTIDIMIQSRDYVQPIGLNGRIPQQEQLDDYFNILRF